jgi:hypothetical protein
VLSEKEKRKRTTMKILRDLFQEIIVAVEVQSFKFMMMMMMMIRVFMKLTLLDI